MHIPRGRHRPRLIRFELLGVVELRQQPLDLGVALIHLSFGRLTRRALGVEVRRQLLNLLLQRAAPLLLLLLLLPTAAAPPAFFGTLLAVVPLLLLLLACCCFSCFTTSSVSTGCAAAGTAALFFFGASLTAFAPPLTYGPLSKGCSMARCRPPCPLAAPV